MKRALTIVLFSSLFAFASIAQNLVPNPSFEVYINCPTHNCNITDCANWLNFGNTPDYYNSCALPSTGMSVPNTMGGFQYAHTGEAIAGIVTWLNPSNDSSFINYREYIGLELTNTLQIGQKYYFSFYTNYSGYLAGWRQVANNKIGLKFTTLSYDSATPPPLNNFAHLYTNVILNDTVAWIRLSSSFIADSAYKYITIGNFFDDNQTDTSSFEGPSFGAEGGYYYIDDVCVSIDSLYNEIWAGAETQSKGNNVFLVYPNPVSETININSSEYIKDIELMNSMGQVIYTKRVNSNLFYQFEVTDFPVGIYLLKVKTKNNFNTQLVNINH